MTCELYELAYDEPEVLYIVMLPRLSHPIPPAADPLVMTQGPNQYALHKGLPFPSPSHINARNMFRR